LARAAVREAARAGRRPARASRGNWGVRRCSRVDRGL